MKEPFEKAWWSFDLGKYRPCESTYQRYDYETIPPLDEKQFDGTFSFLAKGKKNAKAEKKVEHVKNALREVGLELPEARASWPIRGCKIRSTPAPRASSISAPHRSRARS